MTSDGEREVVTKEHRDKMRVCLVFAIPDDSVRPEFYALLDTCDSLEQRATAAEADVERLNAVINTLILGFKADLAAERRLKDAAVRALWTRWERWLRVDNANRDNDDARETFARICNLDRATFDELGIAGDGTVL